MLRVVVYSVIRIRTLKRETAYV